MDKLNKNTLNAIVNKIRKININGPLHFYSDGSCKINDGKNVGTFGLLLIANTPVGDKMLFSLTGSEDVTTNNRMELSGMISSYIVAEYIYKMLNIASVIHCDSQYAINTLFGDWARKKNKDLFDVFDKYDLQTPGIKAEWVRGHAGDPYNEFADVLCELELYRIKTLKNE